MISIPGCAKEVLARYMNCFSSIIGGSESFVKGQLINILRI
jgi:hypothetical protein